MAEGGVAKQGELSLLGRGIRKEWKKKYCALHRKSHDSHPCLEFFESKKNFDERKKADKRIELQNVKGIYKTIQKNAKGEDCQLTIHSKSGKHSLLFQSEEEINDWEWWLNNLVDICSDKGEDGSTSSYLDSEETVTVNSMYETTKADSVQQYDVTIEESPFTKLNDLSGNKKLLISGCDLALQDPKTKAILGAWPFSSIRRYGMSKKKIFLFEGGRHCRLGEGTVNCQSNDYKEIHGYVLHQAQISSRAMKHVVTETTQEIEDHPRNSFNQRPANGSSPLLDKRPILPAADGSPTLIINPRGHHSSPKGLPPLIPIKPINNNEVPPEPVSSSVKQKDNRFSGKTSIDSESASRARHKAPAEYMFVKGLEGVLKQRTEGTETPPILSPKPEFNKTNRKSKDDKKDDSGEGGGGSFLSNIFSRKKSKDKSMKMPVSPVPLVTGCEYEETDIVVNKPVSVAPDTSMYSEAVVSTAPRVISNTDTQYAQPYAKSRLATETPFPDLEQYELVENVRKNAWQSYGRKDEEEIHDENYLSIQKARQQKEDEANLLPHLPSREYGSEDIDGEDYTYDKVILKGKSGNEKPAHFSENIYGRASAKPVPLQTRNIYGTASGHIDDVQNYEGISDPEDNMEDGEEIYNTCDDVEIDVGNVVKKPLPVPVSTGYTTESLYDLVE